MKSGAIMLSFIKWGAFLLLGSCLSAQTINWSAPTGVVSGTPYTVSCSTTDANATVMLMRDGVSYGGSTASVSRQFTDINTGSSNVTVMYFVYYAVNNGTPQLSGSRGVTIMPATATLPAPTGLSSDGKVLDWVSPYGSGPELVMLAGYDIASGSAHSLLSSTGSGVTEFSLSQLTPGQSVDLSVRAKAGAPGSYIYSDWTTALSVVPVDTIAPSQPTMLTKQSTTSSSYTVSWNASTDNVGVASYEILQSDTTSNANGMLVVASVPMASGGGTTFTMSGLQTGYAYYVRVVARDLAGNRSVPSDAVLVSNDASVVSLPAPVTPSQVVLSQPASDAGKSAISQVVTASAASATLVGTMGGDVSVDNHGSADYSMPLALAPGRDGLQPHMAISYNSGGGNGPLGVGFSLSTGFPSAITRGRSILARDDEVRGVCFDSGDKWYLDGKRLLLVSASTDGATQTYTTEVESFLKIVAHCTSGNVDYFEVADKDGMRMIFGKYNGATDGYQQGGGETQGLAYAYALKHVEDVLGNFVDFKYDNPADGEYVISEVDYAGRGTDAANASVYFGYEFRDDAPRTYIAGRYFEHSQRLATIAATSTVNQSPVVVAGYSLKYNYSIDPVRAPQSNLNFAQATGRSRLEKVIPVLADPQTQTLLSCPPTTFGWSDFSETLTQSPASEQLSSKTFNGAAYNGENIQWGDFAGTGKDTAASAPAGADQSVYTADINGDGVQETYTISIDVNLAFTVTGSGTSPFSTATLAAMQSAMSSGLAGSAVALFRNSEGNAIFSRIVFADFNGDGRTDMLIHAPDGYLYLFRSTGTSFLPPVKSASCVGGQVQAAEVFGRYYGNYDPKQWGLHYAIGYHEFVHPMPCDLNGDGMTDYVFMATVRDSYQQSGYWATKRLVAVLANADGTFSSPVAINDFPPYSAGGFWSDSRLNFDDVFSGVLAGDFNGDGLTDFLVLDNKGSISDPNQRGIMGYRWLLYLSKGQDSSGRPSFEMVVGAIPNQVTVGGNSVYSYFRPVKKADWDAPVSLAVPGNTFGVLPGQWLAAFSGLENGACNMNVMAMDVNHDGLTDYVWYVDRNADDTLSSGAGWYALISTGRFSSAGSPTSPGTGFVGPVRLDYLDGKADGVPLDMSSSVRYCRTSKINHSIDVNGDGQADWFIQTNVQNGASNSGDTGTIYYSSVGLGDLVTSVVNGLGSETTITYLAGKDASIYTKGVAPSQVWPIRDVYSSTPVVADIYKDSGVDPSSGADPRAHFSYQYSGNRLDLSGRGSLGFHSFVTIDRQTNIFKYQFLAQSFPMTGLVTREQTYRFWQDGQNTDFRLISTHDNDVVFDEVKQGQTVTGSVYPFIAKAVESRWEDSNSAQFTYSDSALSSHAEPLFSAALPASPYISITAESWFDSQSQSASPVSSLPGNYSVSDRLGSGASSVVGYGDSASVAALSFPQTISYGNLTKLKTTYDASNVDTVVYTYKPAGTDGSFPSLVDTVTKSATSAAYGTDVEPVKRYDYWKRNGSQQTSLVDTEYTDASDPNYSSSVKYNRDADTGRVLSKTLSATGIGTYTVESTDAAMFDDRFDLPKQRKDAYSNEYDTTYQAWLGSPETQTDPNGVTTTTTFDALGRVLENKTTISSVANWSLKTTTTFAWTTAASADWKAQQTVSLPTAQANLISLPAGTSLLSLVSAYATRVVPDGQPPVTTYYDRLGRVIRTIKEGYNSQKIYADTIYTNLGQVVASSDPYLSSGSPVWHLRNYDALGRVSGERAPNGTTTAMTFSGRVTKVVVTATDRDAQTTVTENDVRGHPIKVWNANNAVSDSNITTTGVANSTPSITYSLDGLGRMRATSLKGLSSTVGASYDPLGKQASLSDPDKGAWTYTNDSLGRLISQTDARGVVTKTQYDKLNRPILRNTNIPSGEQEQTNWYYYATTADAGAHQIAKGLKGWLLRENREESVTTGVNGYQMPKVVKAYYYDTKGRVDTELDAIDNKWFYRYTGYDDFNRVTEQHYFWRPLGYEDATIQPYNWNDCGFTFSYDAEGKGYVTDVKDSSGNVWWHATASTYDYMDRPVVFTKGNAYTTTRTYDPTTGLLMGIVTGTDSAAIVQNLGFTYDGLGNLKSRTDSLRSLSESFTYDSMNRLTTKSLNGGAAVTIATYDDSGNITSLPDKSSTTYTYDPSSHPHAVKTAMGYTMSYDANGNVLTKSGNGSSMTISWTGFDKPRWMTKDGKGSEFEYNAHRSRVMQLKYTQVGGDQHPTGYTSKEYYALGPNMEVYYNCSSGADVLDQVRLYVPGPEGTEGAVEWKNDGTGAFGATRYAYHYDHLGSIEAITTFGDLRQSVPPSPYTKDKQATPSDSLYSYGAWGDRRNPLTWAGAPVAGTTAIGGATDRATRGYTGHEMLDDLGLVHMNGRIYDPLLGRFLSADTEVQFPGNLQSYNRYSYVQNNPLSLIDPSGFQAAVPVPVGTPAMMPYAAPLPTPQQIEQDYRHFVEVTKFCANWWAAKIRSMVTSSNTHDKRTGDNAINSPGAGDQGKIENLQKNGMTATAGTPTTTTASPSPAVTTPQEGMSQAASDVASTEGLSVTQGTLPSTTGTAAPAVSLPNSTDMAAHGNSNSSTNEQHGYVITDSAKPDAAGNPTVVKNGISGQALNQNGTSPRANVQVSALNRVAGYARYAARIIFQVASGPDARAAAKQAEEKVSEQNRKTLDPNIHKRP